jgi:hypothetical protein
LRLKSALLLVAAIFGAIPATSIVTEDWRWRLVTRAKGDYASVPLNDEARKTADAWDLAKDKAAGVECKAFGADHRFADINGVISRWRTRYFSPYPRSDIEPANVRGHALADAGPRAISFFNKHLK